MDKLIYWTWWPMFNFLLFFWSEFTEIKLISIMDLPQNCTQDCTLFFMSLWLPGFCFRSICGCFGKLWVFMIVFGFRSFCGVLTCFILYDLGFVLCFGFLFSFGVVGLNVWYPSAGNLKVKLLKEDVTI